MWRTLMLGNEDRIEKMLTNLLEILAIPVGLGYGWTFKFNLFCIKKPAKIIISAVTRLKTFIVSTPGEQVVRLQQHFI